MKDEEMRVIEMKRKEIEAIAQNVKLTNQSIKKERTDLENERIKFKHIKDDLDISKTEIEKELKHERELLSKQREEISKIKVPKIEINKQNKLSIPIESDIKPTPATFVEKVESDIKKSPTNRSSNEIIKPNLDDISPLNDHESSISGKKMNTNNLLKFSQSDEVEVPLDFGESKRTPKEATEYETINIDDEKIEILVAEEASLYDPSYYFDDYIYEFKKYQSNYKVFQVIRAENPQIGYIVAGVEVNFENNKP
jgi:hypothetical protein